MKDQRKLSEVPPRRVAKGPIMIAGTAMVLAVSLAGVAVPVTAATGVEGVAGALAPIGYLTGGHDPAPPPPPGCTPDSPDPACHPPPPPSRNHDFFVAPGAF
ncbi:MAG TPA: hypothetical protein VG187_19140 [Mycobacterium sp.]|jgi:hypothetical protein|nr:hypothetical protein [Mycobacterium sp.]